MNSFDDEATNIALKFSGNDEVTSLARSCAPSSAENSDGSTAELVFEVFQKIRGIKDLRVCARTLVSEVTTIEPRVARAAIFEYRPNGDRLIALAHCIHRKGHQISVHKRRLIESVREGTTKYYTDLANSQCTLVIPVCGIRTESFVLQLEFDQVIAYDHLKPSCGTIVKLLTVSYSHLSNICLLSSVDQWAIAMAETINSIVEAKDTYTSGHSERVAHFSMIIGRCLNLEKKDLHYLFLGAIMHDIGKIGIPDDILKKPGFLSAEEFDEMKAHPSIGTTIIESLPNAERLLDPIRFHHEKWDGTGYPDGLIGTKIPYLARIVAVADAFDAMTSGRSYSGFMGNEEAVVSLSEKTDLFDPESLDALVRAFEAGSLSLSTGTKVASS